MTFPSPQPRRAGPRDLLFFATPRFWPAWPFLSVIRHRPDGDFECGLLFGCCHVLGRYGFGATVYLTFCGVPHKASWLMGRQRC